MLSRVTCREIVSFRVWDVDGRDAYVVRTVCCRYAVLLKSLVSTVSHVHPRENNRTHG